MAYDKYALENFDSIVNYNTVLDNFEGPMDFLLFLIEKNQFDIQQVYVSKVTEQFLKYMEKEVDNMTIDQASEYLFICAKIIEKKAKSLISKIEDEDEPDFESDDNVNNDELIRALEEYKLYKEETVKLKERETIGYVFKEPDKNVGEMKIVYKDFHLEGLLDAFASLMLRQQEINKAKEKFKEIPKDAFTVADKMEFIKLTLQGTPEIYFDELFSSDSTKGEIIATFQAILELLKIQWIVVEQDTNFGQIKIKLNTERGEDIDYGELDEYN